MVSPLLTLPEAYAILTWVSAFLLLAFWLMSMRISRVSGSNLLLHLAKIEVRKVTKGLKSGIAHSVYTPVSGSWTYAMVWPS